MLSLGSPLTIDGTNTGVPLPFALLSHLPFLQDETALFYSHLLDLFVSVILAQGIDRFLEARQERLAAAGEPRTKQIWAWVAPLAGAAVLAAVLVPITPNMPFATTSAGIPLLLHRRLGEPDPLRVGRPHLSVPVGSLHPTRHLVGRHRAAL